MGPGSSHNSAPQQHPLPGTRPAPFSGCSLRSGVQAPPASADAPVFLTPALAPSPLPRVPGQVPTQSLAVPERLSSQTLPPLKPSPLPAPSSSQGLSLAYSEQAKQPWPLSQAPQRPGAQEPGAVRSGTSGLSGPGPCCSAPRQQSVPGLPREQFSAAELQAGRKLCAAQMGLFWVTAQKE